MVRVLVLVVVGAWGLGQKKVLESMWRSRIAEEESVEAHISQIDFEEELRSGKEKYLKNTDDILGSVLLSSELGIEKKNCGAIEEALVRAVAKVCGLEFLAIDNRILNRFQSEASTLTGIPISKDEVLDALPATELLVYIRDHETLGSRKEAWRILKSNHKTTKRILPHDESRTSIEDTKEEEVFDAAAETMEKALSRLLLPETMNILRQALNQKEIRKALTAAWSPLLSQQSNEGQHVLEVTVLAGPLEQKSSQVKESKMIVPPSLVRWMENKGSTLKEDVDTDDEEVLALQDPSTTDAKVQLQKWNADEEARSRRAMNIHMIHHVLASKRYEISDQLDQVLFAPWLLPASMRSLLEGFEISETEALGLVKTAEKSDAARTLLINDEKASKKTLSVYSLEKALHAFFLKKKKKASNEDKDGGTKETEKHEKNLMSQVIAPDQVAISYEAIGGLESTKETLRQAISYPLKYPHLYGTGLAKEATKGVLLFGPPGTGKTMLAKAVATEGGASFLAIDASVIENKWLGESEKNAKAVFTLARKLAPCVIFIDEIDSILSSRENDDSSHGTLTSVKTTLMQEWDGLRTSSEQRVVVIGSTNRPFDLDEAVLRRLPRRILVDLPDFKTRLDILKVTLREARLAPDVNLTQIALELEGYSGSDLREVCREAVLRVAHTQAKRLELNAVSTDTLNDLPSHLEALRYEDLALRSVSKKDFYAAMRKLSASVAQHSPELNRILDWNDRYGESSSSTSSRRRDNGAHSPLYL